MGSDFICKECGYRSEVVSAIFQLEMSASYTHDGKDFRQHSLRVVGYTLNEDMDTALTVCPNCDNSGTVAECYNQIFICRNCGNDVDDKGGFCSYNSGIYCSRCYKKFKTSCEGCLMADECEIRIANLSKAARIKESLKAKDVPGYEPDIHGGISLSLDSVRMEATPDRPTRHYARDTSTFSSDSTGNAWSVPTIGEVDDDNISEDDDDE